MDGKLTERARKITTYLLEFESIIEKAMKDTIEKDVSNVEIYKSTQKVMQRALYKED